MSPPFLGVAEDGIRLRYERRESRVLPPGKVAELVAEMVGTGTG